MRDTESGFEVVHAEEVPVRLDSAALKGIAQFDLFVIGAMRIDVKSTRAADSIRNASKALTETVDAAFTKGAVPRNWLQIVAQKA